MNYPGDQVTAPPDQAADTGYVPTARRARPARHASPPAADPPSGVQYPAHPSGPFPAAPRSDFTPHPSGPFPAAPGGEFHAAPTAPPPAVQYPAHPSGPFPAAPRSDFTPHPSGPFPAAPGGEFPSHPSGPFPAAPADQASPARGRRGSRAGTDGEDGGSSRGRSRSRSDDRPERSRRGRQRKSADRGPDRTQSEFGDWRETDDADGPDFSGMFMSAPAWEDNDTSGPPGGTGVAFADPDDFSDLSDESLAAWTAGLSDLRINAHIDKRRPSVTKPPRTSPPSTTRPPRATPPSITKPPRSRGAKAAPPKPSKRAERTRPEPQTESYAPPAQRPRPDIEDQGYASPARRAYHKPEDHGYAPPAQREAAEPQTRGYAPLSRRGRPAPEDQVSAPPAEQTHPEPEAPPARRRRGPQDRSFALPSRRTPAAPEERSFTDGLQLDTEAPAEVAELTHPAESIVAPFAEPGIAEPTETTTAPAKRDTAPAKRGGAPAKRGTAPAKRGGAATATSRTRAATAAARKASRRKGNRWFVVGGGLSVIAILAAVVYLVYPSGAAQPAPVSHQSSDSAQAANIPAAPAAPAAPSGWQHISSRSEDSVPLTLTQLFPAQFGVSGASYTRTIEQSTTDCAKALFGVGLQAAVHTYSCSQVMRATYLSSGQNVMGTIGVLNLGTSTGATKVGKATGVNGFVAQLVGPSGPTHNLDKGTGLEEAEVKGHYLILTWVEFANLHSPRTSAEKTQLRSFSANLIDQTANISLTNRMVTGEP
jgi:hypothetical protein